MTSALVASIQRVGGDPAFGAESGLGGLAATLQRFAPPGTLPYRNDFVGNFLSRLTDTGYRVWGTDMTPQSWYDFSVYAGRNCFEIERGLTGRTINPWPVNEATAQCLAAAHVLGQEAQGFVFSQDARRNWFSGVSVGISRDGPSLDFDLGEFLDRLTSTAPPSTLRSGNSIHRFEDLVRPALNACKDYVREMTDNGCEAHL